MKISHRTGSSPRAARFTGAIIAMAVVLSTGGLPSQWDLCGSVAAAEGEPSEAAQELASLWKEHQEDFAGWRDEKQGPTWKQYLSNQPDSVDTLLMPKTVEAVLKVRFWLDLDSVKSDAEAAKNEAGAKAVMTEAHNTLDQSLEKLNRAYNNVLAEAEKDTDHFQDELARLKVEDLRLAADHWFEGTPYHDANVARAKKLKEKWEGMVASGEASRDAAGAKLTQEASAAWPAIASSIQATEGFTPDKLDAFRGKTIRIQGHNRLGSDYNPGDYDYVHEINGMPVAGKFTPAVAEAVNKVARQTGHDLPGSDWDIFAVVEGPGRIAHRTHADGKVKVDGQEVGTVTAEGQQSVPCVVVRIFALHAGPVAVKSSGEAGGH